MRFFHGHSLNISLEDSEDILLESKTGRRFAFSATLSSALMVEFDWNNQPGPRYAEERQQIHFPLGYSW